MHLNELLESIKRHSNPSEAIDKLGRVFTEYEDSLLDRGYDVLKSELSTGMYEAINGPHFDESSARKAVKAMENEDGSRGPHWSVEETTSVANQLGINLKSEKHNKWDWYVAMNMMWSDYYKAVVAMTGNSNTKHFAELAKAWICDKDIADGKMWHYFVYLMCDDEDNDYRTAKSNRQSYDHNYSTYSLVSPRYDREYSERERYPEYNSYGRNREYDRDRTSVRRY